MLMGLLQRERNCACASKVCYLVSKLAGTSKIRSSLVTVWAALVKMFQSVSTSAVNTGCPPQIQISVFVLIVLTQLTVHHKDASSVCLNAALHHNKLSWAGIRVQAKSKTVQQCLSHTPQKRQVVTICFRCFHMCDSKFISEFDCSFSDTTLHY